MKSANTVGEMNAFLKEDHLQDVLLAQGHSLQAQCMDEKEKFVRAITNYTLIDATRYLLEEFIDGFKVMNVLEKIRQHPEQFRNVLCKRDTKLDAVMVDLIFEIQFAEDGTNIRPAQERAVVYWRDFLQDCCGKLLC